MSTRVKITGVPKNVRNDKLLAVLSRDLGIHTNDINVNMVMVNGPVKDILLTFNNHKHASMAQRKFNNFKYTYAQKTYVFTAKLDMGCELTNFPSTEASRLDMHIEILRKQKMVLEEEAKLLQEEQELEIIKAAAFSNPRLALGGISQNVRPASNHDRMQPPGTVQSIPESRSRHYTGQAAAVSNQRGALGPTCRPTNGTFVQSPAAGTSQYIRPANNDRMQPPGTAHSIPESGARHFTGQASAFCNRPTADTCVQLSPVAGTSQYIRPVSNDDRMQPPWTAQSIPESGARHFTGQAAAVSYPRGALCATCRLPADSGVQLSPVAGTSQYIRPVSNDRMQPPGTVQSIPESGARHFTGQAAAVSYPRGALGATCRPPADSGVQLTPVAGTSQYIRPVSNDDRMQPPGTAQSIPESGARHFTGQMTSIKKEQQSDSEMSLNDEDTSSDEEEPQDDPGKPAMDRKSDSKIPSRRKRPGGRYGKKKELRRLKKEVDDEDDYEIRKARYYRASSLLYRRIRKYVKKYLTADKRKKMKYFLLHSLIDRLLALSAGNKNISLGKMIHDYRILYPPEGHEEFVKSHLKMVNEHFGKYKWRANNNTQYF